MYPYPFYTFLGIQSYFVLEIFVLVPITGPVIYVIPVNCVKFK